MSEMDIVKYEEMVNEMKDVGHHFCDRHCKHYKTPGCDENYMIYRLRMNMAEMCMKCGNRFDAIAVNITQMFPCNKWEEA